MLSKTDGLTALLEVVDRVVRREQVLQPGERERMIASANAEAIRSLVRLRSQFCRLSRQEAEVLCHLMAGRTVKEVACLRVVSEATVRTQVKSILVKLETSSQLAATAMARRAGWSVDSASR